jgi:hypothetical protein
MNMRGPRKWQHPPALHPCGTSLHLAAASLSRIHLPWLPAILPPLLLLQTTRWSAGPRSTTPLSSTHSCSCRQALQRSEAAAQHQCSGHSSPLPCCIVDLPNRELNVILS